MVRSTPAQILQRWFRLGRIALPLCLIGFLIAYWLGPHASIFIFAAIIAGLLYTTFWLLYWHYRVADAGAVIFWLLAALAIESGYILARNVAFGDLYGKNDLWLGLQFATIFTLVFDGLFLLFRTPILRMVAQADERLDDE